MFLMFIKLCYNMLTDLWYIINGNIVLTYDDAIAERRILE